LQRRPTRGGDPHVKALITHGCQLLRSAKTATKTATMS
jgi:hypothetical protein